MNAKKAPETANSKKEASFEQSLKRLEQVVEDMESGSLDLEKMIARFEEGSKLVRFCSKKLNEVEQKIDKLVKEGEQLKTEPFQAEE